MDPINLNEISPYIRVGMYSRCCQPWYMPTRMIFDYELILMEEGEWDLTYNGKYYRCRQGDILLFLPGSRQEIYVSPDVSVFQPHIHFDMVYDQYSEAVYIPYKDYDQFTEEEKKMFRRNLFPEWADGSPICRVSDPGEFRRLFFELLDTYIAKPPLYELTCKAQLLRVLELLIGEARPVVPPPSRLPLLSMIKGYVDSCASRPLKLPEVADYFGYNPYYLDRIFQREFGMAIMQRHRFVRVGLAKQRLLRGDSVTQAAGSLGFSSVYAFSRFFKTQTGESPSAFLAGRQEG